MNVKEEQKERKKERKPTPRQQSILAVETTVCKINIISTRTESCFRCSALWSFVNDN